MGANVTINSGTTDVVTAVKAETNGDGVGALIEVNPPNTCLTGFDTMYANEYSAPVHQYLMPCSVHCVKVVAY